MQLNAVVLPAPLGPISPTISHSSTFRLSPSIAVRPPKRMVRSRTSSTDTAALHRSDAAVPVGVVQAELVPGEPPGERPDHLAQTAGIHDHGLEQKRRSDRVRDVELVAAVEVRPTRVSGQPLEKWVDEREEDGGRDDTAAVGEATHDRDDDEGQCEVEARNTGEVLVGEK